MGPRSDVCWFIKVITTINYSYIYHKPQLSHLQGAPILQFPLLYSIAKGLHSRWTSSTRINHVPMPVVPEISSSSTEHHISSKLPSNQHTQKNTKTHIHTHALLAGPHLRIQIWIDYSSYNQLLLVILPPSSFFASCSRKKKTTCYIFSDISSGILESFQLQPRMGKSKPVT